MSGMKPPAPPNKIGNFGKCFFTLITAAINMSLDKVLSMLIQDFFTSPLFLVI